MQECNIEVHFEIWETRNWALSEFEAQGIIQPQKFRAVALIPRQNTGKGLRVRGLGDPRHVLDLRNMNCRYGVPLKDYTGALLKDSHVNPKP